MSQEESPKVQRMRQRSKQITYGKQTKGYQNYVMCVKIEDRVSKNPEHPATPNIHDERSKRSFDGLIKQWRRKLHTWDDVHITYDNIENKYVCHHVSHS